MKFLSFAVVWLFLFSLFPFPLAVADDHIEVKIGFLNPITGPIAVYAPAFTDAAEMAIDHLNEDQDVYYFSLVEGDSGCDGTTAASAAQTLVDSDVVGIAGAACSGATLGAQPVASEAGVPMVSYASTSPAVTVADDGDFLFRVVPSDAQQGVAMAYMAAAHGWQNPGLIYMSNDYGAGLASVVKAAYAAGGVDMMCVDIPYDDDTTDFSSIVAELAASECDSLITVTYATDGAALMEEMALQGIEGPTSPICSEDCPFPIMGADGIADMVFLAAFSDPSAAINVIATRPAWIPDNAERDAFDAAWAEYYDGNESVAIYTHEVYDAVTMIGHAAMDAECASATCAFAIRDSLRALGVGYHGVSGTHSFDQHGDVGGNGWDICQFNPILVDGAPSLDLVCNGYWNLLSGVSFPGATHIKIGMLNPLTGPIAQFAPGFTIAGNIAISYMNTITPLNFQFSLTEANSGCDGTTAATAAQTLIDAGVVGIAGAACSGATLAAMEVAKAAGVPMVSYASTNPALTTADDSGYLFRVVPSDAQQGAALAAVYDASGYEMPALLSMTNDYGAGFANAFKDNYGNDLCLEATYSEDTTDFAYLVEHVIGNDCDSVVMITYATDGGALIEELATQEFDGLIFGGDGIADITFVNVFSDASSLDGLTVTKPVYAADSALGTMFDMSYDGAAEAEGYEAGIYTREVFDAVTIIGFAQATAYRTPAYDDVIDMLGVNVATPGAPFEGASGVHAFDANGDVAGPGFEICTFLVAQNNNRMSSVEYEYGSYNIELSCHSTWDHYSGLDNGGIPVPVSWGCMDIDATNYDENANKEDDSCEYEEEEVEEIPTEIEDLPNCDVIVGVDYSNYAFDDASIKITLGQTVCWQWDNFTINIAQVNEGGMSYNGGFYSGSPKTTGDFRVTFDKEGGYANNTIYYYVSEPHVGLNMVGQVRIMETLYEPEGAVISSLGLMMSMSIVGVSAIFRRKL